MITEVTFNAKAFRDAPPAVQEWARKHFEQMFASTDIDTAQARPTDQSEDDSGAVSLTPSQARQLIAGCGDRIKTVLKVIAQGGSPSFHLKDLAQAANQDGSLNLSGVWAGLTKRVRTVTGDRTAALTHWVGDGIYDDAGNYVDHRGLVSTVTWHSLRRAFEIE